MNLQRLFGLRPKNDTAAAFAEAEASARAALAEATARVTDLDSGRTSVLLSGSADQVTKAESELATARAEVERLTILLSELGRRREAAEREEAAAALRREFAEAEAEAKAAGEALRREYPRLAGEIAALLARECAAMNRISALSQRLIGLPPADVEGLRLPRPPSDVYWRSMGMPGAALSYRVKLPPIEKGGAPLDDGVSYWPPRPREGESVAAPFAYV